MSQIYVRNLSTPEISFWNLTYTFTHNTLTFNFNNSHSNTRAIQNMKKQRIIKMYKYSITKHKIKTKQELQG